jgi:hypothetical protein
MDIVELAQLLLREVECLHGLPVTIVLDWGPQFACSFEDRYVADWGLTNECPLHFTHSQMAGLNG